MDWSNTSDYKDTPESFSAVGAFIQWNCMKLWIASPFPTMLLEIFPVK
jgi:hypothetical protein